MAKPGNVIGWKLDRSERDKLLERFPPRYHDAVADHVTLRTNAAHDPLPPPAQVQIVGHADDGSGLEAMVVTVDGTADRPDGSIFHVTWSLDRVKGRRARESNDLLKQHGWNPFDDAIPVQVAPARFP